MVARAYRVAFEGIEARLVEVQCAISPGIPAFSMVCYIDYRTLRQAIPMVRCVPINRSINDINYSKSDIHRG